MIFVNNSIPSVSMQVYEKEQNTINIGFLSVFPFLCYQI